MNHSENVWVGLDIGAVETKLAVADSPSTWQGPTPAGLLDQIGAGRAPDGRMLSAMLDHALTAVSAHPQARADVVVAVPDNWVVGPDDVVLAPAHAVPGGCIRTALAAVPQVAAVRLVPGSLCLAASLPDLEGSALICDIGASTVDAAICARAGREIRMLDLEWAEIGSAEPVAAMLTAIARTGGTPADRRRRAAALHRERRERAWRAGLILERAARADRYRQTPVYLAGPHGPAIMAEAVMAALRPLAELTVKVVGRLLERVDYPLLPQMSVSGGNALGEVVSAAYTAAAGRVSSIRVVEPSAAARGAMRLSRGDVGAVFGYPHDVGLAGYRVEAGELVSNVLPLSTEPDSALSIEVAEYRDAATSIRIRHNGEGGWLPNPHRVAATMLPPARYEVRMLPRLSGRSALRFRDTNTREVFEVPIDSDARPTA